MLSFFVLYHVCSQTFLCLIRCIQVGDEQLFILCHSAALCVGMNPSQIGMCPIDVAPILYAMH